MTMLSDDTGMRAVRRFEVFTGAGHRREWSNETQAEIIAESYSGAVARRHALAPSQLGTPNNPGVIRPKVIHCV